jgi:apolipoprotein D and lipocalin family protein
VAKVIDPGTNAKLEVKFFPLLSGEYWIIDLGPDYEYAVVGHPSRDYLWILSRAPRLDRWIYDEIIEGVAAQGYEVERLRATKQPRVPTERYFHGAPTNLIKAVYAGP